MTLLLFSHPSSVEHDNGRGHPEAPIRIEYVSRAIDESAPPGLRHREAPQATVEQLNIVHPKRYIDRVLSAIPASGHHQLDGDTALSPGSREPILRAAGAVCAAVDAVMGGEAPRAFCATRPPGHHAEPERAMGFCLFNNVAVGAMHARHAHGVGHIAIFDFDVHHGNGTQAIFWEDPETIYLSTHQWPLYPGTGAREETGLRNNIVNVTCPPGTGSQAWRRAVEREVLPRIDAFAPKLVMLSAGFDAHAEDPLAQMRLTEDDFAWVTERAVELAERHCDGRVISTLEGGYHPPALARSVLAHLEALA